MTAFITLVLMVDCVWMVSITIRVIALTRVTLENAVWLVGGSLWFLSCWYHGVLFWGTLSLSNREVFVFNRNTNFLDIDDCVHHTCANGGLCVDGVNNYSCNCSAGYTGERCLTGRQTFWPLSCWYHVVFFTLRKSIFTQYKINVLLIDWNANFLDIDDCVNHTCSNGGLCVDGVNSYSCNCSAGYTGERCLTGRSKFWPLPCLYHGGAL